MVNVVLQRLLVAFGNGDELFSESDFSSADGDNSDSKSAAPTAVLKSHESKAESSDLDKPGRNWAKIFSRKFLSLTEPASFAALETRKHFRKALHALNYL